MKKDKNKLLNIFAHPLKYESNHTRNNNNNNDQLRKNWFSHE